MIVGGSVDGIIVVDNLTKTYETGFRALKGVSLSIRRGEIFALLGPNGAGKTTMISIICGLVNASSGRVLVDGGLVNPIPIAPTLTDTTDATIAVNLNALGGRRRREAAAGPTRDGGAVTGEGTEKATSAEVDSYRERIAQFFREQFGDSEPAEPQPTAMELLSKSFDTMQGQIARMKLATYAPTVTVEIPRSACGFFEFDRAEELAAIGYEAASRALAALGPPAGQPPVA